MNINRAIQIAQNWIEQKPRPKELDPNMVNNVLIALSFEPLGKLSSHTANRFKHGCLKNDKMNFKIPILKIAVGHSKGSKTVVRTDGIQVLIRALSLRLEEIDE